MYFWCPCIQLDLAQFQRNFAKYFWLNCMQKLYVSFFWPWPFLSLWLLYSLICVQFCFKENVKDILITLSWKYFLTLIFQLIFYLFIIIFFCSSCNCKKTVHTISSTKLQRYILMNKLTGSLIFYFKPSLQFLLQY